MKRGQRAKYKKKRKQRLKFIQEDFGDPRQDDMIVQHIGPLPKRSQATELRDNWTNKKVEPFMRCRTVIG